MPQLGYFATMLRNGLFWTKSSLFRLRNLVPTVIVITFIFIILNSNISTTNKYLPQKPANRLNRLRQRVDYHFGGDLFDFEDFDNETGASQYIVPNIIHFIHFNKTELTFVDLVVLRAAMRNHGPDKIYIHSNSPEKRFTGKYWDWVRNDTHLWSLIEFHHLEAPQEIFGRPLSGWWRLHHGSDIARIRVLMKHGGIYLDNDVYVIKNLDKYRKYEMVLNWDQGEFMENQVLIGHKNARFLKVYLNSYREYRSKSWYYNAGELPTMAILETHPNWVHRVKGDFGADFRVAVDLYKNPNFDWRKLDTIHLLSNHRSYLDPNYNKTPTFDENTIQKYNYSFRDMVRQVL